MAFYVWVFRLRIFWNDNLTVSNITQLARCTALDNSVTHLIFEGTLQPQIQELVNTVIRPSHKHHRHIKGHQRLLQVIKYLIKMSHQKVSSKRGNKNGVKSLIKIFIKKSHQKVSPKSLIKKSHRKVSSKCIINMSILPRSNIGCKRIPVTSVGLQKNGSMWKSLGGYPGEYCPSGHS